MQKKTIEKWITEGKKNLKSYVFYENKVLDLTQFIIEHPGGIKAIKNYLYKDITNILFQVYPHQKQHTLEKIMKFQVGLIPSQEAVNVRQRQKTQRFGHSEKPRQKKKVCFINADLKQNKESNHLIQNLSKSSSKNANSNKNYQNIRQSTHKSNASQATNKSKSKSKSRSKKQNLTSIQIIKQNDNKTYEQHYEQNKLKIYQKQKTNSQKKKLLKQKQHNSSCSFIHNQLDQQKPNFRVPILNTKLMKRSQ